MGEAFAIFGAISAAVGLCLTVRNGIETIYQDIHTFRNTQLERQEKLSILEFLRNRLIDWQDQWMVWHENGQGPLHHHLWGDRSELIHNFLTAINDDLESKRKKVDKISRSWRSKFSYTFVKKKLLVINLGELESRVTRLELAAKSAFSRKHISGVNDNVSQSLINSTSEAFQLVNLAIETYTSSEDLYMACMRSSAEVKLDLGLNLFHKDHAFQEFGPDWQAEDERSKARLRAISASANESKLHFTFLATGARSTDPLVRVHIQNDASLAETEYQRSVPRALGQIFGREKRKVGFDTPSNDPGHRFVIHDASDNGTKARHPRDYENLRGTLSRSYQYDAHTSRDFLYLTKLKTALELIDCGLVFLRTSWFSQLCSCALSRHGTDLGERIHVFRATEFEHVAPSYEGIQAAHCWCMQDPMQGMYVRRLGVLLVEIALETLVFDVKLAANSTDLELIFLSEGTRFSRPKSQQESCTLRLRQAGIDEVYIKVVEYCLQCDWTRPRVQESEDLLHRYYWEILQPLRKSYDILESEMKRYSPGLVRSLNHSL